MNVIPAKPPLDLVTGVNATAIDFLVGYPDLDVPCDASIPHPVDFCIGVAKKPSRLFSMMAAVVLLVVSVPTYAIS